MIPKKSIFYTIFISLFAILGVLVIPVAILAILLGKELVALLILLCIIFLALVFIFRVHYLFQEIEISTEGITFRGFGKKYQIAAVDIVAYKEGFTEDKQKNKTIEYIILYTNKHLQYEIPVWLYANYEEIKIALEKDLRLQCTGHVSTNSINYTSSWTSIFYFFFFCCFMGCSVSHQNTYNKETVQNGNLVEVQGNLATRIMIVQKEKEGKRKGKGSNNIELKLEKYPDFSFQMADIAAGYFESQKIQELIAIPTSEPVTIFIRQDEYEEKIAKTKPLSLFYQYYNYKNIDLYGIEYSNQVLLDKSKYLDSLEPYQAITHFAIQALYFLLIVSALWLTGYYVFHAIQSAQNAGTLVKKTTNE